MGKLRPKSRAAALLIQDARENRAGQTRKELAHQIGASDEWIKQLERYPDGTQLSFAPNLVKHLCDDLGLSVADLFEEAPERPRPRGRKADDAVGTIIDLTVQAVEMKFFYTSVHERILEGFVSLVPCDAPCSILQLNKFYCEGGHIVRYAHTNRTTRNLWNRMQRLWLQHIKRADSPIERGLFNRSKGNTVGVASLSELVDVSEWQETAEGILCHTFNIGHLAYCWMRCAPEDLWVIALRRYSHEPDFSRAELALMRTAIERLAAARDRWHARLAASRTLNDGQVALLRDWLEHGDNAVEMASRQSARQGRRVTRENVREQLIEIKRLLDREASPEA